MKVWKQLFLRISGIILGSTLVGQNGPGLDYSDWNGAQLMGTYETLWGIRIGYIPI